MTLNCKQNKMKNNDAMTWNFMFQHKNNQFSCNNLNYPKLIN